MAQKQATRKSTKTVQIIARLESKADSRKVAYVVRSSNGVDQYQVSLFDGAVTGCSCPSHGRCYHIRGVQIAEENHAQEVAARAEVKAEAKMATFKSGMAAQYGSDPRPTHVAERQSAPLQRQGFNLMR